MENEIAIYNETNEKIAELKDVKKVLESACQMEQIAHASFNVILVDQEKIHTLNRTYRGIDRVTDVITFALEDEDTVKLPADLRILGDIYICLEKAKSQALEYRHSLKRELSFLAVHGFYHLLGYDHQNEEEEKVMFARQEAVLAANNITRE